MTGRIALELYGDSLGGDTVIRADATSNEPFSLEFAPPPLLARVGSVKADGVRSEPQGPDRHALSVDLIGWITPRPLERSAGSRFSYPSRYGNRLYPFLSSVLVGAVTAADGRAFDPVVIAYADPYRPGWQDTCVRGEPGGPGRLAFDAHTRDGWLHCYRWRGEAVRMVSIHAPIRLVGPVMSRAVTYPILYSLVALAGIAIAASLEPQAVWPATLALLIFMLDRWSGSDRPHRFSLMSAIYLAAAAATVAWAAAWLAFDEWAVLLALPYLLAGAAWSLIVYRFTRTSRLPSLVTTPWRVTLSSARAVAQAVRLRELD